MTQKVQDAERVIVEQAERAAILEGALLTLDGVCDELVRHDLDAWDVSVKRLHESLKASDSGRQRVPFKRMMKDWNTLRDTRWAEDNTLADLLDADGKTDNVLLGSALVLHGVWLQLHRIGCTQW